MELIGGVTLGGWVQAAAPLYHHRLLCQHNHRILGQLRSTRRRRARALPWC